MYREDSPYKRRCVWTTFTTTPAVTWKSAKARRRMPVLAASSCWQTRKSRRVHSYMWYDYRMVTLRSVIKKIVQTWSFFYCLEPGARLMSRWDITPWIGRRPKLALSSPSSNTRRSPCSVTHPVGSGFRWARL